MNGDCHHVLTLSPKPKAWSQVPDYPQVELAYRLAMGGQTDSPVSSQVYGSRQKKKTTFQDYISNLYVSRAVSKSVARKGDSSQYEGVFSLF